MRRWHALIEPTVPILLLACIVHAVRQNLFDLLLFGGTAVLIVADSQWPQRRRGPAADAVGDAPTGERRHWWRLWQREGWWRASAVVVVAMVMAVFEQNSGGMRVLLYVAAVVALAVVAASAGGGAPEGRARQRSPGGWQVWAVIGVVACLWELTSFSFQQADPTKNLAHPVSDTTHPAASDLIGPLLGGWPGRAVFLLLWGAAGVWLLRRIYHGPASTRSDGAAGRTSVLR